MNTENEHSDSPAPLPAKVAENQPLQLPSALRERKQWCLARPPEKRPLQVDGRPASPTDPSTWIDFETANRVAQRKGWQLGYVLTADDPFTCIDLDVKPDTTPEQLARFRHIISSFDSYTEYSRSGKGYHVWVEGKIGKGGRDSREGVEIYSQERFIICTGNVVHNKPIESRLELLAILYAEIKKGEGPEVEWIEDDATGDQDWYVAKQAFLDNGEIGRLFRGDWEGRYASQSEADLALVKELARLTTSNKECWSAFRLSVLGKREKAARQDYARSTIARARQELAKEAEAIAHGKQLAEVIIASGGKPRGSVLGLRVRNLGDLQPEAIDWLWTGWIPRGFITLIVGETGAGKSTGIADIVAGETTGRPWPGETTPRQPGAVLWLGSEDPVLQVTVPRLDACGANRYRVNEIQGTFSLQDDIDGVRVLLKIARDIGTPYTMLVIDPVTSYLPGKKQRNVNANDAGHIRSILEPWLRLAEEFNLAIVCVTHLAKDSTRSVLHRVLHSGAFSALCRSLVAFMDLKDEGNQYAKGMFQIKTNLPEHPGGAWRFSTVRVQTGFDPRKGKPIVATRPEWEELDSALTPENSIGIGRERGPVSQYGAVFPIWLKGQFLNVPPTEGLPVGELMRRAIDGGFATKRWWNEHSSEYLDKKNFGGAWYCRPKV